MAYDMNIALGLDEEAQSSSDSVNHNSAAPEDEIEVSDSSTKRDSKQKMHDKAVEDAHEPIANDIPIGNDFISDVVNELEQKFEGHCSFPELEQAYIVYCEYGRLKGFSVRKGDQKYIGNTKDMRWKDYLCSSAGPQFGLASSGKVAVYRKQVTRTNCGAKIRVHPVCGQWKITTFLKDHNHDLVPPHRILVSTNVMFGIGFLSDEKTETFKWLLDAFLEAMDRKQPVVVFSDQCRALMNAIDSQFPSATHRLCQWHVNNNATKHLGSLNGNTEFKRMWHRCMNGVETEEDFEALWTEMMATHVTTENEWLQGMYELRRRWASVFSQNIFTAGMRATSRSEGTNRVLKALTRATTSLYEFATAYEKIQSRWRQVEAAEDTACIWQPGQFINKNTMLTQAATIYTRAIYKKFEFQFAEALNYEVDSENARVLADGKLEFKVARSENTTAPPRRINFDPITTKAWCSCRMWEGHGILCRHILRVYIVRNVRRIPPDFILKRWTKAAKKVDLKPSCAPTVASSSNDVKHMDFVSIVMRNSFDMASLSKDSIVAQNYVYKLMEAGKLGLLSVLRGGVPPPIPTDLDPNSENFQFGNPNKVRDRYAERKKNEVRSTNQKKKCKKKCPGISTKSRKKMKKHCEGSPKGSAAKINTNLSLGLNNAYFRATQ